MGYSNIISIDNNESIEIYPTVFNESIFIVSDKTTTIEIINQNGKIIRIRKVEAEKQTMSLSELTTGIYFVKIGNEVTRIIKK